MAKGIAYKNMNAEQKKLAEAWAKKWNMRPEECPMLPSGRIITNMFKIVAKIGIEDYNIISKHYVENWCDITDEVRAQYRADMAQLKADNLPKARLRL